jgi:hypothetical protein
VGHAGAISFIDLEAREIIRAWPVGVLSDRLLEAGEVIATQVERAERGEPPRETGSSRSPA